MATASRLYPKGIQQEKAKAEDFWLTDDDGTRGGGRLLLRVRSNGSKLFYFRYSIQFDLPPGVVKKKKVNGKVIDVTKDEKKFLIPIGTYSYNKADGFFTLDQARDEFRKYSALHRKPESRHVVEYLAAIEAAKAEAIRLEEEQERQQLLEHESAANFTLMKLCDAYADYLANKEKASEKDVRSLFKLYVKPNELASVPAKAITGRQITTLLRDIVDAGKGRTAGKLRSSMGAAYTMAAQAALNPSTPTEFTNFGVTGNPVLITKPLTEFSVASERTLNNKEMGALWKMLLAVPYNGPLKLIALRICIALGGQRAEQLVKAKISSGVDLDEYILTLKDPKGRRSVARLHPLPLVGIVIEDVAQLVKRSKALKSDWLFASGEAYLRSNTVSNAVTDISRKMVEDGISTAPFRFGDLRRTSETMMSSLLIDEKILAHLLSHGLSGVQHKHYNRYEYLNEKQMALEAWHEHLEALADERPTKSKVRTLKRA